MKFINWRKIKMKKILALVLALTMVAAMAACTPANNNETTGATVGNT